MNVGPPDEGVEPVGETTATAVLAPPARIIVLPVHSDHREPAAEIFVGAVRQAMLRTLRGVPNLEIVDVSTVELAALLPRGTGSLRDDSLLYLAVSKHYGSRVVVEVSERSNADSPNWNLSFYVHRGTGSGGSFSYTSVEKRGDSSRSSDPESVGARFAESIARGDRFAERIAGEWLATISPSVTADSPNALGDATRSDEERLQGLSRLRGEGFDNDTLAATVDLGSRATSAQVRRGVWTMLRRDVYDPMLAHPLSYALLADPDDAVRKEAALALGAYRADSGAAAALAHARDNDRSLEVRLAARMASMGHDEQQAFRRETLLNRNLTPAERLAPMSVDDASMRSGTIRIFTFGAEEREIPRGLARVIADTDDPQLKVRGLQELQRKVFGGPPSRYARSRGLNLEPEIITVLIDSLAVDDDRVSRPALSMLTSQAHVPEVRTVLQALLEQDPKLAAHWNVAEALARPSPGGPRLPRLSQPGRALSDTHQP